MSQGSSNSSSWKLRAGNIGKETKMEMDMDSEMGATLDEGRASCLGLASGSTTTIRKSNHIGAHIKPWSKRNHNSSHSLPNHHPTYYHNLTTHHQPISRETSIITNTPMLPFFHKPAMYPNTRAQRQTADITFCDEMLNEPTARRSRRQRLYTAFRAFKRPLNRAQSEPLEVGDKPQDEDVIMETRDRRGLSRRNSNMVLDHLRRDADAMIVDSDSDSATEPDTTMDRTERDAMVEDILSEADADVIVTRAPSPAPTEVEDPEAENIVAGIRSMGIIVRDYAYIQPPRPKTKPTPVNLSPIPLSTSATPSTSASDVTVPTSEEVAEADEDDDEITSYPTNDTITSSVPFTPAVELFDARKGIGHVFFRWQQVKGNERQFPILGSTLRRLLDLGWVKEGHLKNPNLVLPMDLEALAAHDSRPTYPWRPMVKEPVPDMAQMEMYASVMRPHFAGYEKILEGEAYERRRVVEEEEKTRRILRDYEVMVRKRKVRTVMEHRQMERAMRWREQEERRRREAGEEGRMVNMNKRRREMDEDGVYESQRESGDAKKRRITPVEGEESRYWTSFSQPNLLSRSMSFDYANEDEDEQAFSQPLPSTSASTSTSTRRYRPLPRNANVNANMRTTAQLRAPSKQFPAPLHSYDPEVYPEAARIIGSGRAHPLVPPPPSGATMGTPPNTPPGGKARELEREGEGEGGSPAQQQARKGNRLVHPREVKAMKRAMSRTQTFAQLIV